MFSCTDAVKKREGETKGREEEKKGREGRIYGTSLFLRQD